MPTTLDKPKRSRRKAVASAVRTADAPRPSAIAGVTFTPDGRMSCRFDSFGPDAYKLFIKTKRLPEYDIAFDPADESYTITAPARFADLLGIEPPARDVTALPLPPFLYDDQRCLTVTAFDAKRFAIWSACGSGKTVMGLEWARQVVHATGGRVLIVTLNEIVPEWIAEAAKFYGDAIPIVRLTTREEMKAWAKGDGPAGAIAITNYEKFNPDDGGQVINECRQLAGVVLDEASRLKASGGKQKWAIIKSFKGVEYKLSLTATPAPNDVMEFASQASFLEKLRSEGEILWTYFTRDPKTSRWGVKPHARTAFYEFMSSWSVYVNDPKAYGWRQGLLDVPKPVYLTESIQPTAEQREAARLWTASSDGQTTLVPVDGPNAIQRVKLSQIAKGFVYGADAGNKGKRTVTSIPSHKPARVAAIVRAEVERGSKVIVWTEFDAESEMLAAELADVTGVATLTGSVKKADRAGVIDGFRNGETRVLITRAKMVGYGLNFQCCSAMVFSGWTDSFESIYQAVRRAVRHGQTEAVRVYFPVVEELESDTLANVRRKEREFEASIADMERCYLSVRAHRTKGAA